MMETEADRERSRLMAELARARDNLRASYRGLPDEEMARPGTVGDWSVKDVLAHVTSWDDAMLPDLERLAQGETPALAAIDLETADFDRANAAIMSQRRDLPLPRVLRDLAASRDAVIQALARVPGPALAEGQFGRLLVQITAVHDREHAQAIGRWRREAKQ